MPFNPASMNPRLGGNNTLVRGASQSTGAATACARQNSAPKWPRWQARKTSSNIPWRSWPPVAAIVFLASPAAVYFTGIMLSVDGDRRQSL